MFILMLYLDVILNLYTFSFYVVLMLLIPKQVRSVHSMLCSPICKQCRDMHLVASHQRTHVIPDGVITYSGHSP